LSKSDVIENKSGEEGGLKPSNASAKDLKASPMLTSYLMRLIHPSPFPT